MLGSYALANHSKQREPNSFRSHGRILVNKSEIMFNQSLPYIDISEQC